MSLRSGGARHRQELPDSSNHNSAKLADKFNAPVRGPQPDGSWEDWMMWDEPEESTVKESSGGQDSPSMEQSMHLSRKRKTTADRSPDDQDSTAASGKRATAPVRGHSVVERRYRTNINAKIADLRDCIPTLKATASSKVQSPTNTDPSMQKLNKATILSTAVSYIRDLERDKRRLEIEISDLRARLKATEREDDDVDPTSEADYARSKTPNSVPPEAAIDSSTSSSWENPAQGMIQVPEDMRRLRTAALQAQYAEQPYLTHVQDVHETRSSIDVGESGARRAKQIGKLMVGSFAGLMIMQGFGATERDESKRSKRSLAIPPTSPRWTRMVQISVMHLSRMSSDNMQYIVLAMKAFLVLSLLGFGLFLYAFCSKPKQRKQPVAQRAISVPSLASPLELRRNAWLTSIQTVRVPRHAMFPEWAAVNLEAFHYVIRQAVGWPKYSQMTGQSEDDEIARVRAWDIAIDAQLMGGDAEISGSRLILTALASGTLPTTPARLMLKALHVRILLWKASKQGESSLWSIVHRVAAILAAQQWRLAQNLQRAPQQTKEHLPDDAEAVPEHLTALLQLSCNEVLTDHILQRAYNLAWSRPTQEDVLQTDPEMDLVVEDSTIRSPLDAICAWLSSSTLHRALFAGLADNESNSVELEWNYGVALHTAPRASIAQARALAANAVFVNANRRSALSMLSQDFPSTAMAGQTDSTNKQSNSAIFIDSSIPEAVGYDVTLATYCALALSKLDDPEVGPAVVEEALELVSLGYQNVNDLTWLSYAAAHRLILAVVQRDQVYKQCRRLIAQMVPRLISWVKNIEKCEIGLGEAAVCSRCTTWCHAIARIGKHMLELNESITNLSKSCATEEKVRTPKAPEASKEPAKGRETASLGGVGNTRRHSRSSQDSGYASGEA
ncbi:MAG: hypothetical protein HETSPECPRED_000169 [Heterodermia speciosa]|uniref:BHLH domain-containing protein n=1 Tax=Heterodermia speciosa TaxID=116794 RepID=A0A8H3I7F1_9LECA|nr:MAG: hypothetical protein HETSPECPRED_000169 [Heterodermia speciosa]